MRVAVVIAKCMSVVIARRERKRKTKEKERERENRSHLECCSPESARYSQFLSVEAPSERKTARWKVNRGVLIKSGVL